MNELQKFIMDYDLTEQQASAVLGVSRATIYNNLSGDLSNKIIDRIATAITTAKHHRINKLTEVIQNAAEEIAKLNKEV